jgi:hypothetical protein
MAREQRKLAAIVATDVVGYSRLMGVTRAARLRACAITALSASIQCWPNTEGVWSS